MLGKHTARREAHQVQGDCVLSPRRQNTAPGPLGPQKIIGAPPEADFRHTVFNWIIALHFVVGKRGDDILVQDGMIIDQGGKRGQIFGIDKLDGGEECRTSINK